MPIADPEGYPDGHFRRVYEYLIRPACKLAGFDAIRADDESASGDIKLDILKRLARAEMAVCDISARNPNVLYELGIRHALKRPVALIKDKRTARIFDIDTIRYVGYDEGLRVDTLEDSVKNLAKAIADTAAKNEDLLKLESLVDTQEMSAPGHATVINQGTVARSRAVPSIPGLLMGHVSRWREGIGFVQVGEESYYFHKDHIAKGSTLERGNTVYFLPAPPVPGHDRPVATCIFSRAAQITGRIVKRDDVRGFGFVRIEDPFGTTRNVFYGLLDCLEPVNVGDEVSGLIGNNATGPVVYDIRLASIS